MTPLRLDQLPLPVVQAPMAGGPSTPALAAAVSGVGGLGFLAAGYRTPEQLAERIAETRRLTDRPFGVNLFVPPTAAAPEPGLPAALARYRDRLRPQARRLGVTLPETLPADDDDRWREKAELLLALDEPVAAVSFTFGPPPAALVRRLRAAGTITLGTVTSPAEAAAAAEAGVDALCVQGPEAGGHRGTHAVGAEPDPRPLGELLAAVRRRAGRLPLVAAGGIAGPREARAVLDAGAVAVQAGTAYLRAAEAGTNPAHRDALVDTARFGGTVVTRAFTGRPARALHNEFTEAHDGAAPAAYPQVHHLTRPLRGAAATAGEPGLLHLWAGLGHAAARAEPAAAITRALVAG